MVALADDVSGDTSGSSGMFTAQAIQTESSLQTGDANWGQDQGDAMANPSSADQLSLGTQAFDDDPFYFAEWGSTQPVTTLHTSRTYQLLKPNGEPYTDSLVLGSTLCFTLQGVNGRNYKPESYDVSLNWLSSDDGEQELLYVLDGLVDDGYEYIGSRIKWQIPSGTYRISSSKDSGSALSQEYRVVNDGLFHAYYNFYEDCYAGNDRKFSVKDYSEGYNDEDYDGIDGQNEADEQAPFVLASDTRLKFHIDADHLMSADSMPQLESIALWKAPAGDKLESYQLPDDPNNPGEKGKYKDIDPDLLSRVPEILKQDTQLDELPAWPNIINYTEDDELTPLWNRTDPGATADWARFVLDPSENAGVGDEVVNGTSGSFIVDHASFSNAVAESGVYFPVVTVTVGSEKYLYAYYPITVDATGTAGRGNPHITTDKLPIAHKGIAYSATLTGRTGAAHKGEFAWSLAEDSSLPAGLELSAGGVISGTPTVTGSFRFTIKLTETIGEESFTGTRLLQLNIGGELTGDNLFNELFLGNIEYTPGYIMLGNDNNTTSYVDFKIPISLDLRDEALNLGETELYYMVYLTSGEKPKGAYYMGSRRAADLISEDGTTLQVTAIVEKGSLLRNAKTLVRIRAFLLPKDNDGNFPFDRGKRLNGGTDSDGNEVPDEPEWRTLAIRYAHRGLDGAKPKVNFVSGNAQETRIEEVNSGDLAYYDLPEMPNVSLENPDITFGSCVSFSKLSLSQDALDSLKDGTGRIRIWPYNGTSLSLKQQTYEIDAYHDGGAITLAPGVYSFVAEGKVPVYDALGVATDRVAWVDILAGAEGAAMVKNTRPQQGTIVIGPNEGTLAEPREIKVTYSGARIAEPTVHILDAQFELAEKDEGGNTQYADRYHASETGYAEYEASWYRYKDSEYVLVATGDEVTFGQSNYPLYVEVSPIGWYTAPYWKSSGKVLVWQPNEGNNDVGKAVTVNVPRKKLFTGTFTLKWPDGITPTPGDSWGIVEVRTPLQNDGCETTSVWVKSDTVTIPNLTSGSTLTFTPRSDIEAGKAVYVVEDNVETDFTAQFDIPQANGIITFAGLKFEGATTTAADGSEETPTTTTFALDDGFTDIKVERLNADAYGNAVSVPFTVLDGSRIVLEPEPTDTTPTDYYLNADTIYRITVTRTDAGAGTTYDDDGNATMLDKFGTSTADYAAQETFEVVLSPSVTAATVPEATLISRGYATLSLDNPANKACTLLLFKKSQDLGDIATGDETLELKDSGLAGTTQQLRTSFLDANDYVMYAVDAGYARNMPKEHNEVIKRSELIRRIWGLEPTDTLPDQATMEERMTNVSFTIKDRKVIRAGSIGSPTGEASELVDRTASYVRISTDFQDKLSIQMHAELLENARLTDKAYLEISTNQPSGISGAGYTSPKALSFNGKPITINRWTDLFRDSSGEDTQNMYDGSLAIGLHEAVKSVPVSCPLDMTLVIPRVNTTSADVSVWLVSESTSATGDPIFTRSLVGSTHQDSREVSIVAPPVIAWDWFYVYGETGPSANVSVYLNGMRAASAKADQYGYYTARITLPTGTREDETFKLRASAQWQRGTGENTSTVSAVSEAVEATYSTYYPAIERITMFYQSTPGDNYHGITTYDRGCMPNRYATVYRAEREDLETGKVEHAKNFWMVEFANGEGATDVKVGVPRSTSTIEMDTSDSLPAATSWIKATFKEPEEQNIPHDVSTALSTSNLHSFVSAPSYFTYSPDEVTVSFSYDGDVFVPMQGASDLGAYKGYKEFKGAAITQAGLEALAGKMATNGNIYVCSQDTAARIASGSLEQIHESDLLNASEHAQALMGADEGSVDEYLLMGDRSEENQGLLLVHHTVTTKGATTDAIRDEIAAAQEGAKPSVDAVEAWLNGGPRVKVTDDAAKYKGNWVVHAAGTKTTMDESYLYYISTEDDNHDAQVETLEKFYFEGHPGKYCYSQTRADKSTLTITSWDELHGQKVVGTYTITAKQVGSAPCTYISVLDRWDEILCALDTVLDESSAQSGGSGLDGQALASAGDSGESGGWSLGTQSLANVNGSLVTQDVWSTLVGIVKGEAQGWVQDRAEKEVEKGNRTQEERQEAKEAYRGKTDYTDPKNIDRVCENGSRLPDFLEGLQLGKEDAQECGKRTAKALQTASGISGAADAGWTLAKELPAVQGFMDWFYGGLDSWVDGIRGVEGDDNLYYKFRSQYNKLKHGKMNYLWLFKLLLDKDTLDYLNMRYDMDPYGRGLFKYPSNKEIEDPSGIVYEAVLSNPVEGATVRLFTYNTAAASAELDPAQFLDSKQFGIEENPQVTGADGRYQWFVPEGYWQIRVSKEGYESVSTGTAGHEESVPTYDDAGNPALDESGNPIMKTIMVGDYGIGATKDLDGDGTDEAAEYWMPVLPVQLDVNIPLKSTAKPTVESMECAAEGMLVTFSKYVKVDTVTADLFTIAQGQGGAAKAAPSVQPVNADEAADGSGVLLASKFLVAYPAGTSVADGAAPITCTIADPNAKVESYAGSSLADEVRAGYTQSVDVELPPVSIAGAQVTLSAQSLEFNRLDQHPTVTSVVLGGKTLVENRDYTVAYPDSCKELGTYEVTVTGQGRYKDMASATFEIRAKQATPKVVLSQTSFAYTGGVQKPEVEAVIVGGRELLDDSYTVVYPTDSKEEGVYKVVVELKGNYAGSSAMLYTIGIAQVTPAIELSKKSFTYNGKVQRPAVTVRVNGIVLDESEYSLSWSAGCKDAGTYQGVVNLKGRFRGKAQAAFSIAAKRAVPTVVLSKKSFTYNGKVQKPAVTVKVGSTKLAASGYSITWSAGCKAVGAYTASVKLKGNYSGSGAASFTIVPKGTSLSKLSAARKAFTAKWKKQATQTAGYQVQYSLKKSFKSSKTITVKGAKKTSKKITKLKAKKKYYVRVRTYKKVGKTTYYSAWSKTKTVKTR